MDQPEKVKPGASYAGFVYRTQNLAVLLFLVVCVPCRIVRSAGARRIAN
jgi:hypothetical protein